MEKKTLRLSIAEKIKYDLIYHNKKACSANSSFAEYWKFIFVEAIILSVQSNRTLHPIHELATMMIIV